MSDVEVTTVNCEYCGHDVTPFNPVAKAHICKDCLEDIQVGDRYTQPDTEQEDSP